MLASLVGPDGSSLAGLLQAKSVGPCEPGDYSFGVTLTVQRDRSVSVDIVHSLRLAVATPSYRNVPINGEAN